MRTPLPLSTPVASSRSRLPEFVPLSTNVHGPARETPTPEQESAEDEAAEAARKLEERRRVRQRNTAWRAATEVRTAHPRTFSRAAWQPCR